VNVLPIIPTKKFFSVGEVAILCCVPPHTIRYWASEFSKFIKPIIKSKYVKYYHYEDVQNLRKIRKLLYVDGFTIRGAKRQLNKF
jgi:DNA-binding transcriptional MerR regulator